MQAVKEPWMAPYGPQRKGRQVDDPTLGRRTLWGGKPGRDRRNQVAGFVAARSLSNEAGTPVNIKTCPTVPHVLFCRYC